MSRKTGVTFMAGLTAFRAAFAGRIEKNITTWEIELDTIDGCLLLAQMRSADRIQKCLLFGVDRTYRRHVLNDANDP